MGTFPTDISPVPIGLCHAAPPVIPARQSQWMERRWMEWEPWCAMFARRVGLVPSVACVPLKVTHRSRVIMLLSARVTWAVIKRHRLDNPLDSNEAFEFQLRAAVERRRVRMGRVKGVRRGRID